MSTNGAYQGAYNGGSAAIDITSEDLSFAETKFKHPEKSTAGTCYYKIAEQTCTGTYQRIDETFLVTSRSNAAILNIMLASSSTKQFISYRVAWLPVNYGAETALCNRFYFGLSGSGEGNTFQIWLSKNQWSESVAFHPIGNNAEGYKISTWTGTDTGDTNGQTTAPTFTTTIVASQQYMPRTGGTWTGPLFFNSDSLPSTSTLNYICGIDSFADGGDFKYTGANNLTVGKANTLTTARTINGTSFNGSANITTSNWGTARTLTIGNTGKSVNGSTNISWSLGEIGAAASSHTHSNYLTTSGTAAAATKLATARTIALSGDVTGSTSFDGTANVTIAATVANDSHTHSDGTITSVGAGKITGTLAIAHGGTGGTTRAVASRNIFAANAPITAKSSDTTANWGAQGPGVFWYTTSGQLTDQPSQYGFVTNITCNSGTSEVHQLWATQSSGNLAHRGGNSSGWSGTWRTILDSSNYTSYCASTSHTHSYLPLSGGTLTGSTTITGENLKYKNTNCSTFTTSSSATAANGNSRVYFTNNNNQCMGEALTGVDSTNYSFMRIEAVRPNGSATYYNTLNLKLGPTGQCLYSVTSAAAFRNSLGLGNTSGALPVANGGTGATAKRQAKINLGITAGTGAAPSTGTYGDIYIQYT